MFKTPRAQFLRATAIGLVCVCAPIACNKLDQVELPSTNPNPPVGNLPSPQPGGTVVVGLPSGSPTPTPAATPSPGSSPAPSATVTATATATPNTGSCTLASMPDGSPCSTEAPVFLAQVEAAQADVLRTRPDLFDGSRVRSEDAYVQEVARLLRTRSLCASQGGPKDEVAVKNSNNFSEQYDIVLGNGQPWTSYQVTCRPSRF